MEVETPFPSVTLIVMLNEPEAAVPLSVALAALNVSQDGSPEALQVNGAVPELTENACEYVSLCVAAAKLAGEITGAAFTTIVKGCCAISPTASLTCTVNEEVPGVPVGVPEIAPVALSVMPAGVLPLASDQVYAPEPPVACSVCTG